MCSFTLGEQVRHYFMTAEKNLPLPQSAVEKEKLYGRPRQLVDNNAHGSRYLLT